MSTVRQHLGLLWLSRRALMTSNPQYDRAWAEQAALFVGVHLEELMALAGGADLEDWVLERAGEIPADFPRAQPVAAPELDVEAERREMALRRLLAYRVAGALLYTDGGELQDASAHPWIDFKRDSVESIEENLRRRTEAELAARRAAPAPVSTEQAAGAPGEQKYRLLDPRDTIEATDEWLSNDTSTWAVNPSRLFDGMHYVQWMLPARRRVAPSNSPVGAKEQE